MELEIAEYRPKVLRQFQHTLFVREFPKTFYNKVIIV